MTATTDRLEVPVGAGAPPLAGQSGAAMTFRWITNQVPTILGIHERHGDIASIRFANGRGGVLTRSPDDIKQLFTAPPELVPTSTANSPIGPFVGESSLLTLNGSQHLRHRKLLLPPFHGDRMRGYADDIATIANTEIDRWQAGELRKLQPGMQSVTLEVILRIVFGVDDAARHEALRRAIVQLLGLTERPALLLPTFIAAVRWGKLIGPVKRYAAQVDELIHREIELRRSATDLEQRHDVLSMLLTARDEDGEPMSDQELRDELVTILFAGHETTASALAWSFERLVRTPAAMDLATEAARGSDPDGVLDAVFQETLRNRPVVPVTARLLKRPFTLSGYELPKNTLTVISILGVNHHPARFDDPHLFRPERFIGEKPDAYAWIPFGGGVRRCIGAAFAQLEGRIVLREVLRRATLEAVHPADEVRKRRNVTTVPGGGALVRLARLTD
ncbi:MAG: cytochrome P450 [Solirubrobacteraceae bacterium]|nr:cytochrome P450 [Solirubrobacteraceae bacterium]